MSAMPDTTEYATLILPTEAPDELAHALRRLVQADPAMGSERGPATSLWERVFRIEPSGARFIANAITQALDSNTP